MVERAFRDKGLDFRPVIEVAHHQTLLNMVAAGLGVTVLPTLCVPLAAIDAYQVVPLRPRLPSHRICVVTLRGRVLAGRSKVCARLIVDALRQGDAAARPRGALVF